MIPSPALDATKIANAGARATFEAQRADGERQALCAEITIGGSVNESIALTREEQEEFAR